MDLDLVLIKEVEKVAGKLYKSVQLHSDWMLLIIVANNVRHDSPNQFKPEVVANCRMRMLAALRQNFPVLTEEELAAAAIEVRRRQREAMYVS